MTRLPAVLAAALVATTTTLFDSADAVVDIPANARAAPETTKNGKGLTAVFTKYNLPAINNFSMLEGAGIEKQFCSRVQQVNFYDGTGGGDPLDAYVRDNNFTQYVQRLGISPPKILQADQFNPPGSFFDNVNADQFGSDFFGYINIEDVGSYTFCLGHDDGAQLFIANQLVVNQDLNTGYRVDCDNATFSSSGLYPIVVRSFDDQYQSGIVVFYERPSNRTRIVVPKSAYFPTQNCYGDVFKNDGPIASGDPHFKTWSGQKFSFQGACDLVLLHSDKFANSIGLDIHIRTKHRRFFSYITSAVVRIGHEIFEVTSNRRKAYYLNGIEGVDFPNTIAGYSITYSQTEEKKTQAFVIDLGHGESIIIKTWSDFVSVQIDNGSADNFGDSVGLMGSFGQGQMLGRDGTRVITDADAFGQEWMVRPTEARFFQFVKPQLEQCEMPSVQSEERRRRLGETQISLEMAKTACANVPIDEMDFCIYDVIATSDIEVAGAY